MKPDPGLQPTRDIRVKISHELGNDPHRLVEYYMAYQRQVLDSRLRPAPGGGRAASDEAVERQAVRRK